MEPIGGSTEPQEVEVAFAGPEPQRRLTVAFRILLLIPHGFLLLLLGIAVYFVVIVAWFAALILGRVPTGMADFIGGAVRYTARVYAYGYLLTDRYPPFTLSPAEYPVSVTLHPGRLNRLAVLFRIILMIPAYVVAGLVGSGLSILMFFTWLIVLVAGQMPASLHQAVAAVLRYQTRYYAYLGLVTSAYPSRLFGDQPSGTTGPVAAPFSPTSFQQPSPWDTPPTSTSPWESPPSPPPGAAWDPAVPSPPPTAPWDPAAPPALTGAPLATRLVLTPAARRIIVAMIVIGVLSSAGSIAISVATAGSVGRIQALNSLNEDYSRLAGSVTRFESEAGNCSTGGGLSCAQSASRDLGAAFAVFGGEVQSLSVPAVDQSDADRLVNDSQQLAGLLGRMATAPTQDAYLSLAQQFQSLGTTFDSDYRSLGQDLLTG